MEAAEENIFAVLPIFKVPATPEPPETINEPVVVLIDPVVEVIAKPDTLIISVDGLNVMVESLEIADPDEDGDGENKIECVKFDDPAATIFTLAEVVPEELLAVIGTQLNTPAEVDCSTDVPVAGDVAGKV